MARYFFDVSDGVDIRDDTGHDLPDLQAARSHAISRATKFVAQLDDEGKGGYIIVTIRDAHRIITTLRLVCHIDGSGVDPAEALTKIRAAH
ncbi:MAG: hypothetical protein EOO38_16220 [Cytophagaceae bacterium]|nr:MAG: hypothetical protein EOO38_16220 [Cytophagaceae bacterium]